MLGYDDAHKLQNPVETMLEYKRTGDPLLRNSIVMHYSYIARHVASQTRGITDKYAQLEDMVNQGVIALIDCIDKYNPELEVKFESYAYIRVKGSMLDFVRKQDWIPRRVRKAASEITAAHDSLANTFMRQPTSGEVSEKLGISEDELHKLHGEIATAVTISFEDLIQGPLDTPDDSSWADSFGRLFKDELRGELVAAIDALGEREKLVISLYYKEELKFSEIAKVLGVSEARICQIHSKAILKMRGTMKEYMKG